MNAREIGIAGEQAASEFLAKNGYVIIARNFHSRYGEVDIIARNDTYIVFVEVKARKPGAIVTGVEAVGSSKRRKIMMTALDYLSQQKSSLQPRFDVIDIIFENNVNVRKLEHIINAFDVEEIDGFF